MDVFWYQESLALGIDKCKSIRSIVEIYSSRKALCIEISYVFERRWAEFKGILVVAGANLLV